MLRLTGESVFTAKTYDELVNQNTKCEFDLDNPVYGTFTRATVDLLKKMLDTNPFTRITADEALGHPFFTEKDVLRPSRINTITQLEEKATLFVSHSDESVQGMPEVNQTRRYHSKDKEPHQTYRNFARKNLCNTTGLGIK